MINNTGKTVITLPQYFKDYGGYYTVGAGKVSIFLLIYDSYLYELFMLK